MHIAPIVAKHPSGEDIYLFTLRNTSGMEICVSNYGGIVTSWKWPMQRGVFYELLLGFDKLEDYFNPVYLQHYPWMGAAIGRYANRIKNARFTIEGTEFVLPANNFTEHLHGGDNGFDKTIWNIVRVDEQEVVLSHTSPAGHGGYPGKLDVLLTFSVSDNGFGYRFTATSDAATPVNLTHHGYFNLDNGAGTISEHEIRIPADYVLAQGENFVPGGDLIPVSGTPYDFRQWRKINVNSAMPNGFDQSFVVKEKGKSERPLLAAEARSLVSGITLRVFSTEPVVHFYTGSYIPVVRGHHGVEYGPFSGFCLETQIHPNAVNVPSFPTTILHPGETYVQETFYEVVAGEK